MEHKTCIADEVVAAEEAFFSQAQSSGKILHKRFKRLTRGNIISGYCNLSKDVIIEIDDQTDSRLLGAFGYQRDSFFRGMSSFIVNTEQRTAFLETFLTRPLKEAYHRGERQHEMQCFVKFPTERRSRRVNITVHLTSVPGNDDIIGFMNMKDITVRQCNCQIRSRLVSAECGSRAV